MKVVVVGTSQENLKFWPGHSHNCWEIIYKIEGSGKYIIDGKNYPFNKGHIILIPPNTEHIMYCKKPSKDIFIRMVDDRLPREVKVFNDDTQKSILNLLNIANRSFHKRESDVFEPIWQAIYALLFESKGLINASREVEMLKNILIDNISNSEFQIKSLTNRSNYCIDHIRRIFKAEIAMTPIEFLNKLRIEQACNLLKNDNSENYTVGEIGAMCGFYDASYFSRIFKKKTGLSPANYRKREKSFIND